MFLENDRILLKLVHPSHAKEILQLRIDNREFLKHFEPQRNDRFFTLAEQQRIIHDAIEMARYDEGYQFSIFKRDTLQLMGRINLNHVARGVFQNAYLGYFIAKSFNGQGVATDAVGLIVKYAFEELRLHRIQAATLIQNTASQRVLLKNGFRHEGEAKKYLKINGVWEDHLLFGLTCEDLN